MVIEQTLFLKIIVWTKIKNLIFHLNTEFNTAWSPKLGNLIHVWHIGYSLSFLSLNTSFLLYANSSFLVLSFINSYSHPFLSFHSIILKSILSYLFIQFFLNPSFLILSFNSSWIHPFIQFFLNPSFHSFSFNS